MRYQGSDNTSEDGTGIVAETCHVFEAIIDFGLIVVKGDESSLCKIWNDIERQLKNEDFLISCTTNNNCYGVNCSGATRGYNISSSILLHACENPPSVEFEVDVPKLGIRDIKRRITHSDSIPLTKNLNIEFEIERRSQILRLGLFVHFINNGTFPLLHVPMRIPVISNLNFPINCSFPEETTMISSTVNQHISSVSSPPESFLIVSKGNVENYSNCSIMNSTACNDGELCQQIDKMKSDGICICITNYTRNEEGKCVLQNQPVDYSSASLLVTAILVPIFIVLILAAAIYISIRFRVFQHLRRRLRVQVYEHVLLGEDEEEDMANPVA